MIFFFSWDCEFIFMSETFFSIYFVSCLFLRVSRKRLKSFQPKFFPCGCCERLSFKNNKRSSLYSRHVWKLLLNTVDPFSLPHLIFRMNENIFQFSFTSNIAWHGTEWIRENEKILEAFILFQLFMFSYLRFMTQMQAFYAFMSRYFHVEWMQQIHLNIFADKICRILWERIEILLFCSW